MIRGFYPSDYTEKMKKKQLTAVITALSVSLALAGCTMPSPFQVMDKDGMINENPVINQTPDPVKPESGANVNDNGNTDNPDSTDPENTADNDALIEAFINGEGKAKFDHVIADEDTYYTLEEMVIARGDEILNNYFGALETETTMSFKDAVNYAYIDCGNDGVKDLGININYVVDPGYEDSYEQYLYDDFILMVIDGELKCITMTESYYRSYGEINQYSYISEGGSGGANLHVFKGRFVNEKGEIIYDQYCEYYMGNSRPTIQAFSVPKDIREDCPPEEFDFEGMGYNTSVYNFKEIPDYPTNLTWGEDGYYDDESRARYEKYEEEYNEWLRGNIFVFEDGDGGDPEIPADLKKFMDDNNITHYTQKEMEDVLSKHHEEIGLSETVASGDYPEWINIYDHTSLTDEELEAMYVGEYVDDLNDPNLQIAKGSDGKYIVQIGIYRLCFLDDGVGELYPDRMDFGISNDNGGHMEGYIVVDDYGTATVTFTDSKWDYIENGDTYVYKKSSDTPNIFEYEFED